MSSDDDTIEPNLASLLADETVWAEARPDGADDLLAAIRQEPQRAPLPTVPPPQTAPPAPEPPVATPQGEVVPITEVHRLRKRYRIMGVAAAVALVVGVAVGFLVNATADEGQEVDIAGTELAPDATAVANVEQTSSGVAIRLDVSGLPPAEPGTYYQGWLKGPDGLVTIGTFHMQGGDDVVDLWAGVELDRYPTLTVTLQQEGAGQESSGEVVLTGEVG